MRGNVIRWLVAVATMGVVASGCEGCGPKPTVDCTTTTISFETPTSGQTVDSPFDVAINVKDDTGAAFNFDAATVSVGGQSFTGDVSGNRATFTGVSATAGAQTLTVSIASGTCSKTATSTVTVRDACTTPAVTVVSFPQDVAPQGQMNSVELPPGAHMQFKVEATCVSGVQVQIKRGTEVVAGPADFVNGVATLTSMTLPDVDGRYDLFAELVRSGTALNTPSSNPAAGASMLVQRTAPMVTLMADPTYGPNDDQDPTTPGIQVRLTGTAPAGAECTLNVPGTTPATQVVTPSSTGDFSADVTVTSGSYTATVTCTDNVGNMGSQMATFVVDVTPPVVTITSPANVDGGATMLVTQSPLQIAISTDAEDGSIVTVRFASDMLVRDSSTVSSGVSTVTVPFAQDGTYVVIIKVVDAAGNSTEVSLTVDVQLSGCGALFSRPGTCPAFLTQTQAPAGVYVFQTTSKSVCSGQAATLFRSDVLSDGGVTAPVQIGATTVGGSGMTNFPSATLTSGNYVVRADVVNPGADAGISTVSCEVTVDLEGPAITSPGGAQPIVINAASDTQPQTPGVQRQLAFSARVPQAGRVDVCTTQAVDPVTSQTRQTSSECGTGWYVLTSGVTSPTPAFTFPEGTYQLKIVVVGGGQTLESAPVSFVVDGTRPCILATSRRLPQDANTDSRLNIAELNAQAPALEFQLDPSCGNDLAPTGGVVVRDVTSGVVSAVRASTTSVNGSTYTVALTGSGAAEADLALFVELTDTAGNKSLCSPANNNCVSSPGLFQFRVDPIAPNCFIQTPGTSQTIFGILDITNNAFPVAVATSADVGTGGVAVTFTGSASRALTPAAAVASTSYPVTGDNTYAIGATCTDTAGNATTAQGRNPRVDLVAPTCYFQAPTDGTTIGLIPTTMTLTIGGVVTGDPTTAVVLSTAPGISNNVLPISGGTATGSVTLGNGPQNLRINYSDAANNLCEAPTGQKKDIAVTVNGSCGVLFASNGPVRYVSNQNWLNRAGAGVTGTTDPASASVAISVTTDCGDGKNIYLDQMGPNGTPVSTPVVSSGGGATFPAKNFVDGQLWTVAIEVSPGTYRYQSFLVSLKIPKLASIGIKRSSTDATVVAVPQNAALIFGAATGNRRVETSDGLVFGSLDGVATDNAEFQPTFGAVTDAIFAVPAIGASAAYTANGSMTFQGLFAAVASVPITSSSMVPVTPTLRLPHQPNDTTVNFVITITSPSGNTYTSTHASEVDVIAPDKPTLSTAALGSSRAASVNLAWGSVNDDGAPSSSGTLNGGPMGWAAGYDVRWATSSVPGNNAMSTATEYFTVSKQDSVQPGSATSLTLAQLPPINTYYVSVRARDEVGNYSTWGAPSTIANQWAKTEFAPATAIADFGATILAADVVGDATKDLLISAPSRGSVGSVFLYTGGSSFAAQAGCGAGCQELVPPDATGTLFGSDVSAAGNVSDDAADSLTTGVNDVLIGERSYSTTGRALLFLGTRGATLSKVVEFRGDAANNNIGYTATIVGDLDGDGLAEIALPAFNFNSGRGRVYFFKGRPFASWTSPVAITSADWVIEGEAIVTSQTSVAVTNNGLGLNRLGLLTLPKYTGDTYADGGSAPEVVIPLSRSNINRMVVYRASSIRGSSVAAPLGALDAGFQTLSQAPGSPSAGTSTFLGFGTSAAVGQVISSTPGDLFVGYPFAGSTVGTIYRYGSWTGAGAGNPTTISGPATFGTHVGIADLDGDQKGDLVASEGSNVASPGNGMWILYQRTSTFETPVGGTNKAFYVTEIRPIRGAQTSSMSNRVFEAADMTGDGGVILFYSDPTAGKVQMLR